MLVFGVYDLFLKGCIVQKDGLENTVFLLSFVGESSTLGDEYTISNRS